MVFHKQTWTNTPSWNKRLFIVKMAYWPPQVGMIGLRLQSWWPMPCWKTWSMSSIPPVPFHVNGSVTLSFFLFLFYFIWIVTHSILHQQWPSTLLRTRRWLHPSENWTNMIDTTDNSPRKVPIPLAWTCGEYIAKYQDTLSSLSFFLFTFKLFQHDTTTYRYQIATHV